MVDDIALVDSSKEAKDGDVVLVSFNGEESLMKLAIKDGVRVFRYDAPDKAKTWLSDADVVVSGVLTARYQPRISNLPGPLKLSRDDIGLRNDRPIRVSLIDRELKCHLVSLREALMVFDQIDEYGRQHITAALSSAADDGYLRPMDLAVWRGFESNQLFIKTGSTSHA